MRGPPPGLGEPAVVGERPAPGRTCSPAACVLVGPGGGRPGQGGPQASQEAGGGQRPPGCLDGAGRSGRMKRRAAGAYAWSVWNVRENRNAEVNWAKQADE